jgi:hypothetical protein
MASTNTLIQILQDNGYRNTNTNRERTVRNINMLLDAGILKIKLVHADKYNDKDANWAFWFNADNGKKYCTNYKVTLYGQTYFGSFTQKRSVTKYKSVEYIDGTCEYSTTTNYYDNTSFDIEGLQLRVAKLISIIRGNGDFMKQEVFAKHGKCSCGKCDGNGIIPAFAYYANGVCFDCGGSGIDRTVLKSFISESILIK